MATTSYAIALGSNRRHGRHGAPAGVLRAAIAQLGKAHDIKLVSQIRATSALGPAGRGFANAALLLTSDLEPPALLALLKSTECGFGRRAGRRWGPRILDLDILLWSEGAFEAPGLVIPHPAFRDRMFVLEPLAEILPGWRDPITRSTIRQLLGRLRAPRPVDPDAARS